MIEFDKSPLSDVIEILLRDMNSGGNILLDGQQLTKKFLPLIKPRAQKSDAEKIFRTRTQAEVFTPTEVVKFMVDALDDGKIDSRWLEIACGEAPFITNRYDAESGEQIPLERRVGILDRKLRAAKNLDEIKRAVQSVYGYELQGDSLLIARANVLLSFAERAENFSDSDLAEAAEIIAWNFFQFDATQEISPLFGTQIADWLAGRRFVFGGNTMKKFGFAIGNPPYQEETDNDSTRKLPVYNKIMDAARKVAEKTVLITPARFLFNAGDTPKDFNRRMLNDPHFKVLDYAPDAKKYFKGVEIEGGVAVTQYDTTKTFEPIGTFTPFPELNSIHKKVCVDNENFRPLSEIIFGQTIYRLTKKFHEDNPDAVKIISKGHANDFATVLMDRFRHLFFDEKPEDGNEYIQVQGRQNNLRVCKYFRSDWVTHPAPLNKFKILVPTANGSGAIGEMGSTPLIGAPILSTPFVGNTETFITIGTFDTRDEAEACLKYVKGKFCRAMLGILKVTQHATPDKWAKVPLQDFTSASDIDWSVSISEIDAQLYRKYALDSAEIEFIERHVKAMT